MDEMKVENESKSGKYNGKYYNNIEIDPIIISRDYPFGKPSRLRVFPFYLLT